jgi:nucleoside-diphosphate-sugar epimerase
MTLTYSRRCSTIIKHLDKMTLFEIPDYLNDLDECLRHTSLDEISGRTVLITGSTGLIGSFLTDLFLRYNRTHNGKITLLCLNRDRNKAAKRFCYINETDNITFIHQDISHSLRFDLGNIDFIIHAASHSDPKSFSENQISTIAANTAGNFNILNIAEKYKSKVVYLSSQETFGTVPGKTIYSEDDYGLINYNDLRSAYPESKRTGELICKSYFIEKNVDVSIIRLGYVFGPTMTETDTKVAAQFLRSVAGGCDIILKSKGEQNRAYIYVSDVIKGILTVLLDKKSAGETYNLANPFSSITISDMADLIAKAGNVKKITQMPQTGESKGWSPKRDAILNCDKLLKLGWHPSVDITTGITITLTILKKLISSFS